MNILVLPSALALTMNLILCLIVLSSHPKNIPRRVFACFVLSFATWNIGEVIMVSSPNPVHAIFGVKVIFAGLTVPPLFFLYFSFVFPFKRPNRWAEGWRLVSLYLIPVAILVPLVFVGLVSLLFRYRLLDICLIIRGGIVYSIVSGLILAICILLIKSIGEAVSQGAYGRSLWVESAMVPALVYRDMGLKGKQILRAEEWPRLMSWPQGSPMRFATPWELSSDRRICLSEGRSLRGQAG